MDTSDNLIDPEGEVKKLQDLVKKLERQNELLRTKQKLQLESLQNGDSDHADRLIKNVNNNLAGTHGDSKSSGQRIVSTDSQDDQEIIDIDSISLKDEEDSWLYSSPKKPPTPMQSKVSPYKWVRQDFDKPSPEVLSARKTLAFKLEEVARGMGRSPSTPAFSLNRSYTETPTRGNRMSLSAPAPVNHTTPQSAGKPSLKSPLISGLGSRVDTNTFTRPKKHKENYERQHESNGRDSRGQRSGVAQVEPREDVPNVSDIQVLAKMQEESLRQSLNSPLGSPRKIVKHKPLPRMSSGGSYETENSCSPHSSNRSSPGRFEGYNVENTRRSLPNLSRNNGMPARLHNSDPSIDDGSLEDEELTVAVDPRGGSRLHQSSPTARASSPSVSGLKQPMMVRRAMSPQRSGLPTPNRSGIPRPASATGGRSSLPTPSRRSGIPSPRTVGRPQTPVDQFTDSDHTDESWKDGCF